MENSNILLGILGTQEIILIALVVLLIFGGKKIPELMRGLGKGVSEFKKGRDEIANDHTTPDKKNNQNDSKPDLKG